MKKNLFALGEAKSAIAITKEQSNAIRGGNNGGKILDLQEEGS